MTRTSNIITALAGLAVAGGASLGQDEGDPRLRDPSLDRLVEELDERPVVDGVFRPTPDPRATPVHAGLDALGPAAPPGARPAEGTFVVRLPGDVVRLGADDLAFVPDDPDLPGMVLVRSDVHRRVSEVLGAGGSVRAALTGEILLYHDRVLLLPTAYAPAPDADLGGVDSAPDDAPDADADADAGAGVSESAVGEGRDDPDDAALDPRISALEAELERERTRQRGLTPTLEGGGLERGGEGPAEAEAGALGGGDSGFVIRRRGRMVRLPDGWWAVAFDQDGDVREAPMPIVPSRALELMERTAGRLGESWTFEVTGRVVMADGVAQLVPSLFVSEPPSGVHPRQ